MDLTLRDGYSITFCMELTAVMSHHNYYTKFYNTFVNNFIPSKNNEFRGLRQ
jgi:hypothetical protein